MSKRPLPPAKSSPTHRLTNQSNVPNFRFAVVYASNRPPEDLPSFAGRRRGGSTTGWGQGAASAQMLRPSPACTARKCDRSRACGASVQTGQNESLARAVARCFEPEGFQLLCTADAKPGLQRAGCQRPLLCRTGQLGGPPRIRWFCDGPQSSHWLLISVLTSNLPLRPEVTMRLFQAAYRLHKRDESVERLHGDLLTGKVVRLGRDYGAGQRLGSGLRGLRSARRKVRAASTSCSPGRAGGRRRSARERQHQPAPDDPNAAEEIAQLARAARKNSGGYVN